MELADAVAVSALYPFTVEIIVFITEEASITSKAPTCYVILKVCR